MNTINLGNFRMDFQPDFIKLKINEGYHFEANAFKHCEALKKEIYGKLKIGLLLSNDIDADYSIDPICLLKYREIMEEHFQWIIIVSNLKPDFKHYEYISRLTNIPCKFVHNYKNLREYPSIAS